MNYNNSAKRNNGIQVLMTQTTENDEEFSNCSGNRMSLDAIIEMAINNTK